MLKQVFKATPKMIIALLFATLCTFLDGMVYVKMMGLLDYALIGDIENLTRKIPSLILFASLLIPIGIITSLTKGWYRKNANITMKRFYVNGVFRKDISEFQKENTANYLSKLTNDCNTLDVNFIEGIYSIGNGLANFAVGMWIIATVNPWMILLSIGVTGVNVLISILMNKPVSKSYKERSDMFDSYTSYIKEVLSAFHIVKTNNLVDKVKNDYYGKSEAIQQKGYLIERMLSFIFAAQNFLMNTSLYIVICTLGYLAIQGKITVAGILIVSEGMRRMAWPLMMLSEAFPKVFSSNELSKKISNSLNNSDTYEEKEALHEFKDKIELRDVGFHYEDDDKKPILEDVNLTIKKNGKYLIVGPSGGGKSTLLKLLRKYFKATTGEIFIDGIPLRDVKKEDYFSMIANVEQQVFIFEDTLLNNITLYKSYTKEEIERALQSSGLMEFVKALSNGLDTMLYDNGKNISGGERSRIVIARAMLAKASILFLDEAFASLDMERAKEIEKTILSLEDITVINVSHVIFKETKNQYDGVFHVKGTVSV
ncbi:ABC transporter ATP-binding protein [Clostridium sp. Marseille-P299]|uniref:ABC transporter ATP-binding protein n=1 Tax=Clostridium sp. Marseille-P299 TaxID=1805477 RepID=UPI00083137B9|nr:ABC transporter ATP-binding protein [Clostridium sp. Marseille-P299]